MMKLICKQCGKPINTKDITNGKSYHGMCMLEKIKEGSKVRIKESPYISIVKGDIGEVIKLDSELRLVYLSTGGFLLPFHRHDVELFEEEQDLRDLIKVGYRVAMRNGETNICKNHHKISEHQNKDLTHKTDGEMFDIVKIERPCECGNEWILVWKREEKLYTLQCPLTERMLRVINGKCQWQHKKNYEQTKNANHLSKYRFTQDELDSLPFQEIIKHLDKKEVK